jgi:prephenate dehydrogenase
MALQQITIIGVGLIGGSFALAARKAGFSGRIVGCDNDLVLDKALSMRVIDSGQHFPERALQKSSVVLLATPVGGIIDLIERIGPALPEHAVLTDVGSTKSEIVARANAVFGKKCVGRFLPGHPMAGKAHSGITHVDADLFQGAVWIFTQPHSEAINHPGPAADFADLVRRIGARPLAMDLERHDRLVAWVSHLPQMLSTALAGSLMEEFGNDPELLAIGGRALREMTRVAASPYSMWRDIAHTNTTNIEGALLGLERRLAHIRENLRGPGLRDEFERGNKFRAKEAEENE